MLRMKVKECENMEDLFELDTGIWIDKKFLYSKDHVWIEKSSFENDSYKIGLSQPKIINRGPVLFFNFNVNEGSEVNKGDVLAEVETSKSIIYINSPFSGIIQNINLELLEVNELIRSDSYKKGWLATIQAKQEIKSFMNFKQYIECVKEDLGARIGVK